MRTACSTRPARCWPTATGSRTPRCRSSPTTTSAAKKCRGEASGAAAEHEERDDMTDVAGEVRAWLRAHWDAEQPLAQWRDLLADSGWGCPTWPVQWFGRGLSRREAATVDA